MQQGTELDAVVVVVGVAAVIPHKNFGEAESANPIPLLQGIQVVCLLSFVVEEEEVPEST